MSRRAFILALAALACSRRRDAPVAALSGPAPPRVAPSSSARPLLAREERTWSFPKTPVGPMSVVVVVPERAVETRFPVLIAMHGRGETLKGPERGARGWLDDYALGRAVERLHSPPLTVEDFRSFVEPERLTKLNSALAAEPYGGMIIVCPYTPDVLPRQDPFPGAPPLAEFLIDVLLAKVYAETPALGTAASTGIDGVSLGGRAALSVGFLRPEAFGAVAGLQAAIDVENSNVVVQRAKRALEKNPKLRLRLLTSTLDYYLQAHRTLSAGLQYAGVPHELLVVPGPHDYVFNRGPGALEMLVYHDRVLRGRAPV